MLTACTSIYGGHNVIPELPPMSVVENAIWIPEIKAGSAAGLFHPSGHIISEALHYRGIPEPHLPLGPRYINTAHHDLERAPSGYHYIFIQNIYPHFGHFIIGALSRLWALPFAERRKLRLVFNHFRSVSEMFSVPYIRTIWEALELTEENFCWFPHGAIFPKIDVPGASFEENSHVHEIYSEVMERIGHALCPQSATNTPQRITYLSKQNLSSGIWRIANEERVTSILQEHDVNIVYPEQLSLMEQILLWKEGGTFIATSSSALHSSAFAPGRSIPNRRIIVLNDVAEMWSNQVLIDRVSQNNSLYLFDPDNTHTQSGTDGFRGHLIVHDPQSFAMDILRHAQS